MNQRRRDLLVGLALVGLSILAVGLGLSAWRDSGIRMVWKDSVALAASPCFFVLAAISLGAGLLTLRDSTSE